MTIDLHAAQIQGFFDIPVDHLYAAPVFMIGYYQEDPLPNLTVVAPDTGGAERARAYAKRLDAELALCDKRRDKANVAEVMNVVGDVAGTKLSDRRRYVRHWRFVDQGGAGIERQPAPREFTPALRIRYSQDVPYSIWRTRILSR